LSAMYLFPYSSLFFLTHPPPTAIYTLSLHDALPILIANSIYHGLQLTAEKKYSNGLQLLATFTWSKSIDDASAADTNVSWAGSRSEEHTSELQSHLNLVCRLLLEKKN